MKSLQLFLVSEPETGMCFGIFLTQKEAEEHHKTIGIQGNLEIVDVPVKDEHIAIFKKLIKKEGK